MKTIFQLIAGAVMALAIPARGDPLILDSFSQGGFNLSDSGAATDFDVIAPSIVNTRQTRGFGSATWFASLDSGISIMRYQVSTLAPPSGDYSLRLLYFDSGAPFSIADYSAFYLAIPEVTGTGNLYVVAGGNFASSVSHPIFQPGEIFYNFSFMTGGEWQNPITSIGFFFVPTSNNFSVGVDHIALIPEPCGALLLLTSAGLLAMRRRRGLDRGNY